MDFFTYRKCLLSEKVARATKKFDKIDTNNLKLEKVVTKKLQDAVKEGGDLDTRWRNLYELTEEYTKLFKLLDKYQNGKTLTGNKSILLPRDARTNSRRRGRQRGFVLDQKNVRRLLKLAKGDLDTVYEIWNMCLFELSNSVKSAELLMSPLNRPDVYAKVTRTLPRKMEKLQKQLENAAANPSFDPSVLKREGREMIESVNELIDEHNSGLAWFEVKDYVGWIKNGMGEDLDHEIYLASRNQLSDFIKSEMTPVEKEWSGLLPFDVNTVHQPNWLEEFRVLKVQKEKMMNHLKVAHAMKLMIEKLILPEYEKIKKDQR